MMAATDLILNLRYAEIWKRNARWDIEQGEMWWIKELLNTSQSDKALSRQFTSSWPTV